VYHLAEELISETGIFTAASSVRALLSEFSEVAGVEVTCLNEGRELSTYGLNSC